MDNYRVKICNKQYKKQDPNNICSFCYSNEMLRTYRKSVATALQRNSDLLTSKVLHPDALPIINNAFFRFNAHGELDLDKKKATINLENYVNIAIKKRAMIFLQGELLMVKRKAHFFLHL